MLLKIKNDIQEISRLCDETQVFCEQHKISDDKYHDIILILDELATNVIKYAYPVEEEHSFTISIEKKSGIVELEIIDDGMAFNPLLKADPNVDLSIDERQIGGLGIFIVKQLSRNLRYARVDGKNCLFIEVDID